MFLARQRGLKASERNELEKLAQKRSNPRAVIAPELQRKAASISAKLGRILGLLIGRDGRVTHVVLGTKERIYLPDLGRFRLDAVRLRRLRLIVFLPPWAAPALQLPQAGFLVWKL